MFVCPSAGEAVSDYGQPQWGVCDVDARWEQMVSKLSTTDGIARESTPNVNRLEVGRSETLNTVIQAEC